MKNLAVRKLLNGLVRSAEKCRVLGQLEKYREWNRTFHQPRGRNEGQHSYWEMVMNDLAKIDDTYIRLQVRIVNLRTAKCS